MAKKPQPKVTSTLIPLGDRVVVKVDKPEEVSLGGIVIPSVAQDRSQQGLVTAVGAGHVLASGELAPLEVQVGNKVIFNSYAGVDVKVGEDDLLVLQEKDILAVIL